MRQAFADTITAIATASGRAGISVIRISGTKALSITDSLFRGKAKPSRARTHTIHYGHIVNPISRLIIDEVMLSVFRKPNSYTGEDMIEISCHGSDYVASQIVQLVIKSGARHAEPGEFTHRRVLAGKMDLTQAEAILDLVAATSDTTYRLAMDSLTGKVSGYIETLSRNLENMLAQFEYLFEFETARIAGQFTQSKRRLRTIRNDLDNVIRQNEKLKYLRAGVYCAIVGKPNVGKSSLFNRLIQSDKAIITQIPGTTRDSLKESTLINNIMFHFVDTAGLKIIKQPKHSQKVEAMGIKKTKDWLETADLILAVFDNSRPITHQDRLVFDAIKHKPHLIIINKIDRTPHINKNFFKTQKTVLVSAKYNKGIEKLKRALTRYNVHAHSKQNLGINERHLQILKQVRNFIGKAETEKYLESAIIEMRNALDSLGMVTNFVTNEQVLEQIFSRFCIGK